MDRLDAAHALLGVSPSSVVQNDSAKATGDGDVVPMDDAESAADSPPDSVSFTKDNSIPSATSNTTNEPDSHLLELNESSSQSNGCALDALASLASSAATMDQGTSTLPTPVVALSALSSDDDSESMPPPPPRRGRIRSASNPEGMEKWDSLSLSQSSQNRRHFVLPSSILEEELASANAATAASAARRKNEDVAMSEASQSATGSGAKNQALPPKKRDWPSEQSEEPDISAEVLGTSPTSVMSPMTVVSSVATAAPQAKEEDPATSSLTPGTEASTPQDEADMDPAELLRRARSRLLEDLSEAGNMNGEKGVLTLPHSLSKYKELYNKNGRIGIYTPAERAAIIAKFNSKRTRRVWNKKIRYNCRKNLADRRMRVKGRFVKRSTEAQALAAKTPPAIDQDEEDLSLACTSPLDSSSRSPRRTTTPPPGPLPPVSETKEENHSADTPEDDEMPDVTDVEAGFEPTEDQPYRRTRRHTIT